MTEILETIIEQAEIAAAINLANIETLIREARVAERLAAQHKNALRRMGIESYKIAVAMTDAHDAHCSAASLMGDYRCVCKPETAFTNEVF